MATTVAAVNDLPWWKEPTKEQWLAWWAGWLGWTLDAFDVTVDLEREPDPGLRQRT